jgi:ribosomal protein S18 acetylase RimI-like enzyme
MLFSGFDPPVFFSTGEAPGLGVILPELSEHKTLFLNVKEDALHQIYEAYTVRNLQPMWRMTFQAPGSSNHSGKDRLPKVEAKSAVRQELRSQVEDKLKFNVTGEWHCIVSEYWQRELTNAVQPEDNEETDLNASTVRLGIENIEQIKELYADGLANSEAPDFFSENMVRNGVFFGIRKGEELVAAAGTHLVAPAASVAAIGCVYTRRDHRGRGFGATVTSSVLATLKRGGIRTVVLNVNQANKSAIRVYQRLGFKQHCSFFEGIAIRK